MKFENEYCIVNSDDEQFVLQIKKVVQDSTTLKDKSKVGQLLPTSEKYYYPSLESLFKGMCKRVLLSREDITTFGEIFMLIQSLAKDLKIDNSK